MRKNLLLVLIILSVLLSGCDLSSYSGFFSTNSIDGLYISRSNGRYIGGNLLEIYGTIKNSSQFFKNNVKAKVVLKDSHGNHLKTYTEYCGPIEPGKDIPLWISSLAVNGVYATGYELEIVEATEYHNISSSDLRYFQGYHDFSFTITDSSLAKSDTSSLWKYTVKVDVTNDNDIDLGSIYGQSLLYLTNGLIADYSNTYVKTSLKVGETMELIFTYLLNEGETVYRIDFWGSGHDLD